MVVETPFADLIAATATFVFGHLILGSLPVRTPLAARVGEKPFLAMFSVFALATLVWMVLEYNDAPYLPLWNGTGVLGWAPIVLMPFASILVVCGLATPNPTAVESDAVAHSSEPVRGIAKITRHPFLWGVALWALGHVLARGDAASLYFFGGFGLLSLLGMAHLDIKKAAALGPAWGPIVMRSSVIPFLAIAQGRTRVGIGEIGWWKIALALALYVAMIGLHRTVFGLSPLPPGLSL